MNCRSRERIGQSETPRGTICGVGGGCSCVSRSNGACDGQLEIRAIIKYIDGQNRLGLPLDQKQRSWRGQQGRKTPAAFGEGTKRHDHCRSKRICSNYAPQRRFMLLRPMKRLARAITDLGLWWGPFWAGASMRLVLTLRLPQQNQGCLLYTSDAADE